MMRLLRYIPLSFTFIIWFSPAVAVDYYYDDFDGTNTACGSADNWCLEFPYGRSGFFHVDSGGFTQTSENSINIDTGSSLSNGSVIHLRGKPNDRDLAYNNYWVGRTARLDSTFNATENKPFGFEIIRYYAVVDPRDENHGSPGYYTRAAINVWLIENNATSSLNTFSSANDFDTISNFVYMYELAEYSTDTAYKPKWGFFSGTENDLNIDSAIPPDGTAAVDLDTSSTGIRFYNESPWAFEDKIGSCTLSSNVAYDDRSQTLDDGTTNDSGTCGVGNNRKIGIRMTHDGTTVRMYVNPNPEDNAGDYSGYLNQWYEVGQKNVPFNSDMKVMLGQEQLFYYSERTEAAYDHFLVRPVADYATAEIAPKSVIASSATEFEAEITPTLRTDDAGIGEIYLKKPASMGNWDFTNIKVCQDPDNSNTGSACNGAGETLLTAENATASTEENDNPSAGRLSVATLETADNTGDTLIIRFRKTSSADNDVFHSTTAGANLRVYATLTPSAPDATGSDFEVYLQNEKYSDTAQEYVLDNANGIKYATTYRMKASNAATGSMTVKAYSQPEANLAVNVSPDPLYWGKDTPFVTLEVRTSSTSNGPDITQLVVNLPDEPDPPATGEARWQFELKDGSEDTSAIDSLKIPTAQEGTANYQTYTAADNSSCSATYCYNTQTRQIVINYGTSYKIPGRNGFDRITFYAEKAPVFDDSDQITTNWSATVDSAGVINGTTAQSVTAYNSDAANLQTIIRATPPVTVGWVNPNILSNNVSNTNPTTATLNYSIKNQGSTANKVRRIELLVPYTTYNSVSGDPGHPFTRKNFGTITTGDITGIQVDGAAPSFTPSVTIAGNETISGTDYRVVRIDFGGGATDTLNSNETLSFNIDLDYYRNTNSAPLVYEIKHRADNKNYVTSPGYPYPQYTDGGENPSQSWSVTLTPPDPRGEASVFRATEGSDAEVYTNEINSGNITDIKMKIVNLGGIGNNIDNAVIEIPDFLTVTDACSSYLSECVTDGNININDSTKEVTVDYAGAGKSLKSNQDAGSPVDIITFTIAQNTSFDLTGSDDFCEITDTDSNGIYDNVNCDTNNGKSTERKGSFYAKLNNASTSPEDSFARAATGRTLDILFKHPLPAAQAYYTTDLSATYEVDATKPSTTAKLYLKNTATLSGNKIYQFDIQFPTTTIVSGTPSISSISRDNFTAGGGSSVSSLTEGTHYSQNWDAGTQKLTVTYTDSNELDISGAATSGVDEDNNFITDIVEFTFNDQVTASAVQSVPVIVYNRVGTVDTGNTANAGTYYRENETSDIYNPDADDLALFYAIPPAEGVASITPKTVYTSGISETVESKFFIQNKAESTGTNTITRVEIDLPAGVSVADANAVTARGGAGSGVSCSGNDGFTGGCSGSDSENIVIDYSSFSPANLDPGNDADDEVLIKWSHSQNTNATKVFQVSFDNNDGSGFSNLETVPASLLTVEFVPQPRFKIEILERTGDPADPKSKINNQTVATTVPDTHYHRFKVTVSQNTSGTARIHQLKIPVPAPFDASSLDKVDMLPNGTDITVSGSDLLVTFPGNKLSSASTTLEFRLQEGRTFNIPGTHSNSENITWQAQADYFNDVLTAATYTNSNLPGPSFTGKISSDGNDDELIYTPAADYNTPKAIKPVSGSGEASLAWNIIAFENLAPAFTIYTTPKSVFRINSGDPAYTFTNTIRVRNTSETDNDLRIVEFTPPSGILTALADGDLNNVIVRKGTTGDALSSYSTLTEGSHYSIMNTADSDKTYDVSAPETVRIQITDENEVVKTGETLLVEFSAAHQQTTTGSHNWVLKAGNYDETVTLTNGSDPAVISQQWSTDIVTPSYSANFILDKNSISATAEQSVFNATVTNESTGGDRLQKLRIALPGYFDVSSAVISSTSGTVDSRNSSAAHYDTTGLSAPVIPSEEETTFNKDNYIIIDYGAGLNAGETDNIAITINDSFFSDSSLTVTAREDDEGKIARLGADAVTIKASAQYDTSSGSYNYITSFPEGSNRVEITQPEPQAIAYLATENVMLEDEIPGGGRDHNIRLFIENTAEATSGNNADNIIYRAKVRIPREIDGSTVINNLTSVVSSTGATSNIHTAAADYIIYLDYTAAGGITPGDSDEITFILEESVDTAIGGFITTAVSVDNASAHKTTAGVTLGEPDSAGYISDDSTYPQSAEITSGSDTSKTLRMTFIAPDDPSEAFVQYFVDPDVLDVTRKSDREILDSYGDDGKYTVYLIGNKAEITYRIINGSKNYTMNSARINISHKDVDGPGQNLWNSSNAQITGVTSQQLGTLSVSPTDRDLFTDAGAGGSGGANETRSFVIDYSTHSDGGLLPGKSDTVTITLNLNNEALSALLADDTNTYTYNTDGSINSPALVNNGNFELNISSEARHTGVGVYKSTVNDNRPVYLYLRKARFGRISGRIVPANAAVTVQLSENGENNVLQYGKSSGTCTAGDQSGCISSVVPGVSEDGSYATYVIDRVPPGNGYTVSVNSSDTALESSDFIVRSSEQGKVEYSTFTATANSVTDMNDELPGSYQVKYRRLSKETGGTVASPTDSTTKIIIPAGALDNSPRINIRIEQTAEQVYGAIDQKTRQMSQYSQFTVSSPGDHYVYNLVNELDEGGGLKPVVENQLKKEATLQLGYKGSLHTDNGWDESSLAIFYWEHTRQRWLPLGGKVDTASNTVTAKISYMHRTYTLLSYSGGSGDISQVNVFPRVFTPGRSDSYYAGAEYSSGGEKTFGNAKITFSLSQSSIGEPYEVAIYTLSGKKVRAWNRTNEYGQGSIYWNGRDESGNLVSGGIYVYVIRNGGTRYRGTLVVAR